MMFFWTFYSSINPGKRLSGFHKNIKQHNWSVSEFLKDYYGLLLLLLLLCDTDKWVMTAENSAVHHRSKLQKNIKHLKIENIYFILKNITQYYSFY